MTPEFAKYLKFFVPTENGIPQEVNFEEWTKWLSMGRTHLRSTFLGDKVHVSTVFLGQVVLGRNYLWETMVFGVTELQGYQFRSQLRRLRLRTTNWPFSEPKSF